MHVCACVFVYCVVCVCECMFCVYTICVQIFAGRICRECPHLTILTNLISQMAACSSKPVPYAYTFLRDFIFAIAR